MLETDIDVDTACLNFSSKMSRGGERKSMRKTQGRLKAGQGEGGIVVGK
jgi:hypothetical protein